MEYFVMMATHLIKTAHYFIVEGVPVVPLEQIPLALEGIAYNTLKLITIYFSMLG